MKLNQVKRQLRAFYGALGVGARRAEKLIKSDLARVRRNTAPQTRADIAELYGSARGAQLDELFVWIDTPEGYQYWATRDGFIPPVPGYVHA